MAQPLLQHYNYGDNFQRLSAVLELIVPTISVSGVTTPVEGMVTINPQDHKLYYYNGSSWINPSSSGDGTVTSVGLTSSDLTVGGSSSPITSSGTYSLAITDKAVTYAKIQDVNSQKILGRFFPSSGVTQEISLGHGLTLTSLSGILSSSIVDFGVATLTNGLVIVSVSDVRTTDTIIVSLNAPVGSISIYGAEAIVLNTSFTIKGYVLNLGIPDINVSDQSSIFWCIIR